MISNAPFTERNHSLQRFNSPVIAGDIFLTETLAQKDIRCSTSEILQTRRTEIGSLIQCGTSCVLLKEDVPANENILPGGFVLSLKSTKDESIKYKERFVISGNRDRLKDFMVLSSQTLK